MSRTIRIASCFMSFVVAAICGCNDWDSLLSVTDPAVEHDAGTDNSCQAGYTRCPQGCIRTDSDSNNCGGCGNKCPGQCVNSTCMKPGCTVDAECGGGGGMGPYCCAGQCRPNNAMNCGGCDNACAASEFCQPDGTCGSAACQACPQMCCNGGCVNFQNDGQNCGGCGRLCAANQACMGGLCQVTGQPCSQVFACAMGCANLACGTMCETNATPNARNLFDSFVKCVQTQPCWSLGNCGAGNNLGTPMCRQCLMSSSTGACKLQSSACMADK